MRYGLAAGITWALGTVILGVALAMAPFCSTRQAVFLAPFVSTFLHDACSALWMLLFNGVKGNLRRVWQGIKSKNGKWVVLAAVIGGPVGMTGYVLAVNYMGASIGAVASAVYPAVGTVLAFLFLKERVKWYQWLFLAAALCGVYGLSYSPTLNITNFGLGLIGALMCAFGWGIEAVILAKCLKDDQLTGAVALQIRQTTSALVYGALLLPALSGWKFTAGLFTGGSGWLLPTVALAALCASASYVCYYISIAKVGASKSMALNVTYTAWAILFTVLLLKDTSVLSPLTVVCAGVVLVCGIFAAADFKEIFAKSKNKE